MRLAPLFVIVLAACAVETSAPVVVEPVSLATWCADAIQIAHERGTQCHGATYASDPEYMNLSLERTCRSVEPAIAAGRVTFDGLAAARCLASARSSLALGCRWNLEAFDHPVCGEVFFGTVENGAECLPHDGWGIAPPVECRAGICVGSGDACPAACRARPALGEHCDDGTLRCGAGQRCADGECRTLPGENELCLLGSCGDGLVCLRLEGESRCRPRATPETQCGDDFVCAPFGGMRCVESICEMVLRLGDPCVASYNCPDGLVCRSEPESVEKACRPPATLNESCVEHDACAEGTYCQEFPSDTFPTPARCVRLLAAGEPCERDLVCAIGLWCDTSSRVCTPKIAQGQPCNPVFGHDAQCSPPQTCRADGVCGPAPKRGDACDPDDRRTCSADSVCDRVSSVCVAPPGRGEPCNPNSDYPCAGADHCRCVEDGCDRESGIGPHVCVEIDPFVESCR